MRFLTDKNAQIPKQHYQEPLGPPPQLQTLAQPASPSAGSSLQNSKAFCSPVRKARPTIQKKRKLQRKPRGHWSHPGGRAGGGRYSTQARQAHRLGREKLAAPNPPPSAQVQPTPQAPADSSLDATMKDATLPETRLPMGQVPPGGLPVRHQLCPVKHQHRVGFLGAV